MIHPQNFVPKSTHKLSQYNKKSSTWYMNQVNDEILTKKVLICLFSDIFHTFICSIEFALIYMHIPSIEV